MKKNKKMFKTKKNFRWKIIDTVVFSFIFIISISGIIINYDIWLEQFYNNKILTIALGIWGIFFNALPYIIVYLGLRYFIKKYNKSIVTFDVVENLEYYREKFNGISPATMSLLMDLNLEVEKDLGAMKLYYELNDIYMCVRDKETGINNPRGIKLNYSDEVLLKYFFNTKDNSHLLNEWKEKVIFESIVTNLIVRKNLKDKKKVGCGIFMVLHILSFIYIIYYILNGQYYIDVLDMMLANSPTDDAAINILINNSEYMSVFFFSLIFVASLLVYFWSIIGGIVFLVVGNVVSHKDKFKRTKEGNVLTERLYGMKNFIKDFSNLNEATKKTFSFVG